MEPEDRIERMEQDGILSARQAALLRNSLATPTSGPRPDSAAAAARRVWPGRIIGAAALLLIVAGFIALAVTMAVTTGGGGEVQDVARSLNQPGDFGQMNKPLSVILAAAILLIVPLLLWMWLHNALVAKEERVFEAWAQTESNFQRRADLVPALIDTVSRYLKHESETLIGVAAQRSEAVASLSKAVEEVTAAGKAASDLLRERGRGVIEEESALRALSETQARIGQGMGAIVAVAENYPDLRSSDQFLELQAQLEGTENRINVARMRFNQAVRDYNRGIRQLPGALVAQVGSFKRKAYFQTEEDAKRAPDLDFE